MNGNVVLDIDGVILLGGDGIPGAGEALARLEDMGFRLVIATNNATRTPAFAADRIGALTGYRPDPAMVVTSTLAVARMLEPGDLPVLAVADAGMAETLAGQGVPITDNPAEAHAVVIGLDRSFTYERLKTASSAIRGGARFIASNTDPTFPTPAGLHPGAGALVAAVAAAAGRAPEIAGKPHEPMRLVVTDRLSPGPVWMVGDRPDTDIAFARSAGWTAVLALSGVTADPAGVPADLAPDLVITALGELPGLLAQGR